MKNIKRLSGIEKILWCLVVVLFTSFYLLEENVNATKILMVIIVIIFFFDGFLIGRGKYHFYSSKMCYFVIVFIIFCFASAIWANNRFYAIEKGITITSILLCIFVINNFFCKYNNVSYAIDAVWTSGIVLIAYCFFFYGGSVIFSTIFAGERLNSDFANVNLIGMLCAVNIIISINKFVYDKRKIYLAAIIPASIVIVATGSRKALIMAVMGTCIYFVIRAVEEKRIRSALKIIVGLLCVIGMIVMMDRFTFFAGINSRMDGLFALFTGKGKVDSSTLLRQQYIQIGIEQFKTHPLLGIGMGNARIIAYKLTGHDTYLHNNFVELLVDGGIVGLSIYYSIYVYLMINLVKKIKLRLPYTAVLIVILIVMLIADIGMVSYYSKITYFYFMILFLYLKKNEE